MTQAGFSPVRWLREVIVKSKAHAADLHTSLMIAGRAEGHHRWLFVGPDLTVEFPKRGQRTNDKLSGETAARRERDDHGYL